MVVAGRDLIQSHFLTLLMMGLERPHKTGFQQPTLSTRPSRLGSVQLYSVTPYPAHFDCGHMGLISVSNTCLALSQSESSGSLYVSS